LNAGNDQAIKTIGGHGASLDPGRGNLGRQTWVGHDRLDDAIKARVGGGQVAICTSHQDQYFGSSILGAMRAKGNGSGDSVVFPPAIARTWYKDQ
jgi:hypothetical protein